MYFFNSPKSDRYLIRQLGGDFDKGQAQWFVPDGVDPRRFARWLPADALARLGVAASYTDTVMRPTVKGTKFFLATCPYHCGGCGRLTDCVVLIAGSNAQCWEEHEREGNYRWMRSGCDVHVNADDVSDSVKRAAAYCGLRYSKSPVRRGLQFVNHCGHCGAPQDQHLYNSCLSWEEDEFVAASVTHYMFEVPFEASGECNVYYGLDGPRRVVRSEMF